MMFKSMPITVFLKRFTFVVHLSDKLYLISLKNCVVHLYIFDIKGCKFILAKSSKDNKAPVFIDTVPYERQVNTGVRLRKVQVTVTKYQ